MIGDELHFNTGPTEHLLSDVLWPAFWTYTQTVWLIWDMFRLRGTDALATDVVNPAFVAFNEALLARV